MARSNLNNEEWYITLMKEGNTCLQHPVINESCEQCEEYQKSLAEAIEEYLENNGAIKCPRCHTKFRGRTKYCSMACYNAERRDRTSKYFVELVCKECGKGFRKKRWTVENEGGGYCSKTCQKHSLFKYLDD